MRLAIVSTAALNQWALDFDGNVARTLASVEAAKQGGARYRLGPELELTGYGCEDHFLEPDTEAHAWAALATLIERGASDGLLLDVGGLATHAGARYNVRVLVADRRVLLIRPKLALADDGNYRESRYFSAWRTERGVEAITLPPCLVAVTADRSLTAPFGHAILQLADASLACESCEELFTPAPPHAALALAGVDVIANGSGSHHQLRKLHTRLELLRGATAVSGGAYLYSNQRGCDGGRLYYDGCACVVVNGDLIAQGAQFTLADVDVVTATVDLDAVRAYRGARASGQKQAAAATAGPPRVDARWFSLCDAAPAPRAAPTPPIPPRIHPVEEEIAYGPGAWLWDYLRRSGAGGFVLPLSGGADSAAVAAIVCAMCRQVEAAVAAGDATVETDARRVARLGEGDKITAQTLAGRVLTTVYMASAAASGAETRARAAALAHQVGAHHLELHIDGAVAELLAAATGAVVCAAPRFKAHGGTTPESLALQNVQARTRMVLAFMVAQLTPWAGGTPATYRLVLGSANVDEALRGYLTKYDCSSADLNPIGSVSKGDLKAFLVWGARALNLPALSEIVAAPPTAELEPTVEGGPPPQTDEADMGMTYADLALYGRLRTIARCGPVSMFEALARGVWAHLAPAAVAVKVKHFWASHAAARHKATTLTPSYHAEAYSPDDNRFDHRPFLYRVAWAAQFREIDDRVRAMEEGGEGGV